MTTLSDIYRSARARLSGAGIETAAQEGRILIEGITGSSPEDFVCRPLQEVAERHVQALDAAIARRIAGEPVYRILGWREFHGLKLELSVETLEPRPDTETLVEAVLPFLRQRVAERGACRILDLGTGTGAISLALLDRISEAVAVATDISQGALATATRNAVALEVANRFTAIESDWFSSVAGTFDLIVSNPPYIRSGVISGLDREVREHDPMLALDGGVDGLDAYRAIAAGSAVHLEDGGIVALEIGYDQAESVSMLLQMNGFEVDAVRRDLAGNDRVLCAKMRR